MLPKKKWSVLKLPNLDSIPEEKSYEAEPVVAANVDEDALASLDTIWEKSEKGVVTKTEVLNAIMIKIGQI